MQGGLAINLMHFARALRAAGLPVGPGKLLQAVEAVEAVGIGNRADFYWALHAVFVNRRDQREVFDQAFHVFWRNPDILKRMMGLMLPTIRTESPDTQDPMSRRVADALRGTAPEAEGPEKSEIEVDAAFTVSAQERLQEKDFEKMSAAEMAEAKRMLARIALPVAEVTTRRHRPDPRGPRVDPRATLRRMLRSGGDLADLARRSRRTRPPPLVVLCDISGSMTRYSRMLLHFMHAVSNDRDRVHSFVFGTRLTNITRHLRHKDVDVALDAVSAAVADWSGGTRIGTALHAFNRTWARRVLGQGAVVLLITDGLDRDAGEGLATEAERLHKSCRRLVWLNPLLRWEGFAPKSSGIRALLPHVDDFRPVHNLNSLAGLADALNRDGPRRAESLRKWLKEAA
ncbi:von Willebrand factor A [Azospirillum argentinense]|uniref:von Willebrand factor A n=1 Tax=Azospirillum argentinense TaxID=2970906 RepID=A0A060DKX6_9PROT|nr:VWA domain-containing protein [Azospirillum argentinense]AIB11653.1 von Willebrand factor A [Azospirillum argentinense]EZQ08561.1 von Willebrand factor A [Azospirillum argentinense]MBK3797674.1 VWA domain-containing protein [Azospirillum argentinense]